jgi:hypothetical protein
MVCTHRLPFSVRPKHFSSDSQRERGYLNFCTLCFEVEVSCGSSGELKNSLVNQMQLQLEQALGVPFKHE